MFSSGFPPYISVAEKRAKAAKKLKALKKKNPRIKPVFIEGRNIANTWWGTSWNKNLERYADYSNRIGRGRSYLRHGAVLDLQIKTGKIKALVQGSRSTPYKVDIQIKALDKKTWNYLKEDAAGQLDSVAALLEGRFPKELQQVFFAQDNGLFPTPKAISFDCSCPDWASMCKHVAAALYGVGARLDTDPQLFFRLRQIDATDLVEEALKDTTQALLEKAAVGSDHIVDEANLSELFGIDLADDPAPAPTGTKGAKKNQRQIISTAPKKQPAAKRAKKGATKVAQKPRPRPKATPVRRKKRRGVPLAAPITMADQVTAAVPKRRKKVGVAEICAAVKLSDSQVRNALTRAVQQGKLQVVERGIYARTKA